MTTEEIKKQIETLMDLNNPEANKIKKDILIVFERFFDHTKAAQQNCLELFFHLSNQRKQQMSKSGWSPGQEAAFATLVHYNPILNLVHSKSIQLGHKEIDFQNVYTDYDFFIEFFGLIK